VLSKTPVLFLSDFSWGRVTPLFTGLVRAKGFSEPELSRYRKINKGSI
jgi:hypothetical protein